MRGLDLGLNLNLGTLFLIFCIFCFVNASLLKMSPVAAEPELWLCNYFYQAELCPNEGCAVRIHKYCLIQKFSQRKAEKVCPGCGIAWPYSPPEAEASEYRDELNGSQCQLSNERSQRKRHKGSITNDSEDSKAGPIQASMPPNMSTNMRRSTRSSLRLM